MKKTALTLLTLLTASLVLGACRSKTEPAPASYSAGTTTSSYQSGK
ncbi:MAG: hypothetical protein ACR2OZ_05810 [Verrucomicrobiales bacterium]